MRIDLTGKSPESQQTERASQTRSRMSSGARERSEIGEDKACLSLDQSRVRELEKQVKDFPEVRSEKVKALARSVQDGTYDVTPQQTAEAMLSETLRRTLLR